jgi:diguanylate cyclase (GGDEF)-like protein
MCECIQPFSLGEPSPALRTRLGTIENTGLGLTALIACLDLGSHIHEHGAWMAQIGWYPMSALAQISIWLCVLCLALPRRWPALLISKIRTIAATLVVALHLSILFLLGHQALMHRLPRCGLLAGGLSSCFVLLGITLLSIATRRTHLIHIADLLTIALCLLAMVLSSGALISNLAFFHSPVQQPCAPIGILVSLSLLSICALLHRTERGWFSILLSPGLGGKLVRRLMPTILLFPFAREAARARMIGVGRIPPPYITALLASAASAILSCLVLYCAWRIYAMEREIHAMTLRDPLTGLYNLRGFELLAGQTLHVAQRSARPYSVLFIDLDGLKQTNDTFGHAAGSHALMETAEILKSALRETDVLAHIGGDEFVIAGQIAPQEIAQVLQRIEACRRQKNAEPGRNFPIRFSLGYAITQPGQEESLAGLLSRADKAMYAVKRQRKLFAAQSSTEAHTSAPVELFQN